MDDYLAEIAKSKKKKRNKNPLPDSICVFGWCKDRMGNPGSFPHPPSVDVKREPSTEPPKQQPPTPPPGTSTSKRPLAEVAMPPDLTDKDDEPCDPMRAAKDVEVGDFYYEEKNYKGALNRYKLALESWPNEPAIQFRTAKTYELLKDPEHALSHYREIAPDSPLAKEASTAMTRLKK